jgi:hypothetical protein
MKSLPEPADAARSRVRSLITTILLIMISIMIVRDIFVRRWPSRRLPPTSPSRGCAARAKALKPRQSFFFASCW